MATTITTQGVLYINDKQVENSFKNISRITRKLRGELSKLPIGTEAFKKKAEELKRAETRFSTLKKEIYGTRKELQKTEGSLSTIISNFGGWSNIFQIGSAVSLGKLSRELLEISDAITDVEKTSGLATEEVGELWHEFSELDTRTSKMNLMKIAEIGGRLGIKGKENLREFTESIDKAYVALGDSYEGGLEAVTTQLGKLKNLFSETKDLTYPEALEGIGSALNELAASGTASEQNITDFTTKVGQMPDALKPAIDKTLGLGAAFEESGLDARVAASGYSNFTKRAAEQIEAFASTMNMGVEEAKKLLNTKPEEFFVRFAEGMQGMDATATAKLFSDLKLNTLEIQKSVGAAGQNAGRFRDMMLLSTDAMRAASSLTDEFNKKNNNSAAIWTKLGNTIKNLLTDGVIPDTFDFITKLVGNITGLTSKAGDGVNVFKERLTFLIQIIKVAVVSLFSYNAALTILALTTKNATKETILYNLITKISTASKKTATGATLLYTAAKAALTGNIKKATAAMRLFNMVTKMNPIGLLVTAITAAVTAYVVFSKKTDEVARKQRMLNDVNAEAEKQIVREKQSLEKYLSIAKDETIAKDKRLLAMKKLRELAPDYLGDITLEEINTKKATDAINNYIIALKRKAYEQAVASKLDEVAKDKIEIQSQDPTELLEWYDKVDNYVYGGAKGLKDAMSASEALVLDSLSDEQLAPALQKYNRYIRDAYMDRRELLRKNSEDEKTLLEISKKLTVENLGNESTSDNPDPNPDPNQNTPLTKSDKALIKSKEEAYRKRIKAEQKLREEEIAMMEEGEAKDIEKIKLSTAKKSAAIQQENEKLLQEIGEHRVALAEAEKARDTSAVEALNKTITDKLSIIETNNKREVYLEESKQSEIATIREKWELKSFENLQAIHKNSIEEYRRKSEEEILAIADVETAKAKLKTNVHYKLSEQELNGIKTLEEAKKALREEANREVLDMSLKSLEAQKSIMMEMVKSLDGEAADELMQNLQLLDEKITEIKTKMQSNKAGDEESVQAMQEDALSKVDILGFSAQDWKDTFDNLDTTAGKLEALGMAFGALSNAAQMYAQHQKNLNDKELVRFQRNQDKKKKLLEDQVNAGIITQEQYHSQMMAMEAEADAKKRELALKQAKAEKAGRMFAIVGETARAVASALPNIPLSILVGALGAAQLAIVAGQKLPSYHIGGYTGGLGFTDSTGHEVAGAVHANEYVIPEWLLRKPEIANVVDWLEAKRQGVSSSYAEGGYTLDVDTPVTESQTERYTKDDTATIALVQVLHQLYNVLDKMEKEGIDAYVISDAQNGRMMEKAIKEFRKIKDKNKR